MNEIKKELLKTVGDVKPHKERVQSKVEHKLSGNPQKQPKWVPITISIILIAALVFIMPKLLDQTPKMSANMIDTHYLEIATAINEGYTEDEKFGYDQAVRDYIQKVMISIYAQDLNMKATKSEIKAAQKKYYEYAPEDMVKPMLEPALRKHGFTWQDYKDYVNNYVAPMNVLKEKLMKKYEATHPSFDSGTYSKLLTFDMEDHVQSEHQDILAYLTEHYNYDPNTYSINKGVILNVTNEALLITYGYVTKSQKATMDMMLEDENKAVCWIPKRTSMPDVQIGDRISMSGGASSYLDDPSVTYQTICYTHSIEILTDTITLPIRENFPTDRFNWEQIKRESSEPDYVLEFKNRTLQAWLTNDRTSIELYDTEQHLYTSIPLTMLNELYNQ